MPGGVAYYFSHALARLPRLEDYALVTKVARKDYRAVEDMKEKGIDVICRDSGETVFFENIYGTGRDDRRQRVLARSDPFEKGDADGVRAAFYHLGTLLADDFPLDFVRELHSRGRVSADAQGFLRRVTGTRVEPCGWEGKEEWMKHIDIVKVNETEMEALTGCREARRAAAMIAAAGPEEVIVTLGEAGSVVLCRGEYTVIPPYGAEKVEDATGCGDTYMAGYLYCRSHGKGVKESGCFASAMCTSKITHNGPFDGTLDDIRRIAGDDVSI